MFKSIIISSIITILIFACKNMFRDIYYDFIKPLFHYFRYGAYCDYYIDANITKFKLHGFMIKRNYRVKFYVPSRNEFIEGNVIGLDQQGIIYIKEESGDIIMYSLEGIEPNDVYYIEK